MEPTGQRRAKSGGELGVNGEWYEGGKFIATPEDRSKTAPAPRHDLTPEETAHRNERLAAQKVHCERVNTWLTARRLKFAGIIERFCSPMLDQWGGICAPPDPFLNSLALQLRDNGSLSPKQSACAVKCLLGRRNKTNEECWLELAESLSEKFQP